MALVFGFGGLAPGLSYSCMVPHHTLALASPPGVIPGPPLFLLWPGALFCAGLCASFAICRRLRWIHVKASIGRSLAAATFVIPSSFIATYAGFIMGIATAALTARPIRGGRVIPPAHPLIFSALPVIVGLLFGVLIAAILISLALRVVTQTFDHRAWRAMLLFSFVLVAAAIAAHPGVLTFLRFPISQDAEAIFGQTLLSLYIWGYTFYGACTGYWLARQDENPSL